MQSHQRVFRVSAAKARVHPGCLHHAAAHGSEPAEAAGYIQRTDRAAGFAAFGNFHEGIQVGADGIDICLRRQCM